MNIVIMGPPGSGKGTVCEKLVKDLQYKLISAGDLLRQEKASGSELGKQIAKLIDFGNLVPDSVITKIITKELRKPTLLGKFHIIDGYPRTEKQALDLDAMLNVSVVIWLNVSEQTTIDRNLKRGQTSGRPDDSNIEIIKKRIENYNKSSKPIKKYYEDLIVEIDGEGTPDEVYKKVTDTLFDTYKEVKDISDIL